MSKRVVEGPPSRRLIRRLLEMPNLTETVQSLEPGILHQVIRKCGLEDSGEIIALATTSQLMKIFDDDLWRSDQAGAEEVFDADRFGIWLQVLAEMGEAIAARKLTEMDFDFVTAALGGHILVLDSGSISSGWGAAYLGVDEYDPMEDVRTSMTEDALESSLSHEFSGYMVISKHEESWDALLSILICLDNEHPGFFSSLMDRCRNISTEYIEDNGGLYEVLTTGEQVMSDVADDRERRREQEGYVTPAQAVAFLINARQLRTPQDGVPPEYDHITVSYFRGLGERSGNSTTPRTGKEERRAEEIEHQVAELIAVLQDEHVLPKSPLPLLTGGGTESASHLGGIRKQLSFVREHDERVYSRRMQELGYLANVLMAGCSFQSRRFRQVEAADAVIATCNIGLENWDFQRPAGCTLPPDFLLGQDLVQVFRRGWNVVYQNVTLHVSRRLADILSGLRCDNAELQSELADLCGRLRAQVDAGTPWRERDNLDVIAILDQPSWAVLLGLMDECPVVPKLIGEAGERNPLRISSEFDFISENRQIDWGHDFMETLPGRLLS